MRILSEAIEFYGRTIIIAIYQWYLQIGINWNSLALGEIFPFITIFFYCDSNFPFSGNIFGIFLLRRQRQRQLSPNENENEEKIIFQKQWRNVITVRNLPLMILKLGKLYLF